MSLIEVLYGRNESAVRAEVLKRAADAILARFPDIQDCVIDEVAAAVLGATVEAVADDTMRAYMTITGWWRGDPMRRADTP